MDVVSRVLSGVVAGIMEVEDVRGESRVKTSVEVEGSILCFTDRSVVDGNFCEWKCFVPVLVVELRDSENLLHSLIVALHHAIGLWLVRGRGHVFDVDAAAKALPEVAD